MTASATACTRWSRVPCWTPRPIRSHRMATTAEIEQEWTRTLADAGFSADAARVYCFDGTQDEGGGGARWFPPGDELVYDGQFPNRDYVAHANAAEHSDLHRIALWRDHGAPVIGALLRHEFEHARQYEALRRPIFRMQDLIE